MLLVETLVETFNKKIKKYCNSDNREQERAYQGDNLVDSKIDDLLKVGIILFK